MIKTDTWVFRWSCWVSLIDGLQGYSKFRKQLGITPPPSFEIVTSLTLGYPVGRIDTIVEREQPRVQWFE
ncbi:MAG: hypothetical protein SWH68_12990 [Thermodesulfobacteriota bacterium]|nr:hypothetical protein [Thermodesulfobacteriota bacterium]